MGEPDQTYRSPCRFQSSALDDPLSMKAISLCPWHGPRGPLSPLSSLLETPDPNFELVEMGRGHKDGYKSCGHLGFREGESNPRRSLLSYSLYI